MPQKGKKIYLAPASHYDDAPTIEKSDPASSRPKKPMAGADEPNRPWKLQNIL
jgi:hypothetical protein